MIVEPTGNIPTQFWFFFHALKGFSVRELAFLEEVKEIVQPIKHYFVDRPIVGREQILFFIKRPENAEQHWIRFACARGNFYGHLPQAIPHACKIIFLGELE